MNDFLQTLLIATIPSVITALLSFVAAFITSNSKIKAIKEQNKADIEKIIEQNKVDIESLKEKHRLDMELKEKEYMYQLDVIKLQHENDIKREEESMKNQLATNVIGGLFSGLFSQEGPISSKLNEVVEKSLEDAMKNDNA